MKMLVYRVADASAAPFSLSDLKLHLRVDHSEDDSAISDMGMTAAAEIEHSAQIALLTQTIRVTIFDPRPGECYLSLPVGPAANDAQISVTIDGEAFTAFDFTGGNRPQIRWLAKWFDLTPSRISIEYTAGFGATASAIPRDLLQALMDQAGMHYDGRSPLDAKSLSTSPHMARIGARYRGVSM